MTTGFGVQDNLKRCIEKLQVTIDIMIDIYDRIDAYADSGKLADYMANIASAGTKLKMNDTMEEAVTLLDRSIQTNIILEQYEVVIHSFKQHEFPFAIKYMNDFDLPDDLQFNDTESLTHKAINKIDYLSREIRKWMAAPSGGEEILEFSCIEYNSNEKRFSPFYVWKGVDFRDDIVKLLSGNEVSINADVLKGVKQNAVQFNEIGINFKLTNTTSEQNLIAKLEADFDVILTMFSNGFYRCDTRIYDISTAKNVTFIQSFKKKTNSEEPISSNDFSQEISKNDPFLSPYAMWSIKIINVTGLNRYLTLNI